MKRSLLALGLLVGLVSGACGAAAAPASPDVPVQAEVRWVGTYQQDIQPIFNDYCVTCHGALQPENGLRLDSYAGVMAGTRFGPVVVPGSAGGSTLLYVLQGETPPQVRMPHNGLRLSANRLENIRLWIDAGAAQD